MMPTGAFSSHRGFGFPISSSRNASQRPILRRIGNDDMEVTQGSGRRHGSGARLSSRERDRDRPRTVAEPSGRMVGNLGAQAGAYRMTPTGPQEEADWSHALETLLTRVLALENNQRQQASSLAKHTQEIEKGSQQADNLNARVISITERIDKVADKLSFNVNDMSNVMGELKVKAQELETAVAEMRSMMDGNRPQLHHIATPVTVAGPNLLDFDENIAVSQPVSATPFETPAARRQMESSPLDGGRQIGVNVTDNEARGMAQVNGQIPQRVPDARYVAPEMAQSFDPWANFAAPPN